MYTIDRSVQAVNKIRSSWTQATQPSQCKRRNIEREKRSSCTYIHYTPDLINGTEARLLSRKLACALLEVARICGIFCLNRISIRIEQYEMNGSSSRISSAVLVVVLRLSSCGSTSASTSSTAVVA